ncbi:capsid cement protein [Mycolicibacter sinensis]|uniref:DUF2190 domain-containing protein n=1 Tax=Mycolicibacter sinensis (strain JDM601) TaxID=875328 RepID=A0A1A3UA38_MYCSD|nr:capsid cement protein [Mycolicibacter sinensis]OBK91487.1 hypothetical protein A5648_14085 [Mycolicibacter sinensis]
MPEATPLFRPGAEVTALTSAAVTGKRFVGLSATRDGFTGLVKVAHAGQGAKAFGVAAYDAASGATLPILRGGIVPVTAGGSITAGDQVEVGTDGKAVKLASGVAVGQAIETATSGDDVFVALFV